jgi:hypothetical protein
MFKTKKGTEKPIEIFVALFVILAVALLMLRLFQNQVTDKKNELEQFQRETAQQNLKDKAFTICTAKCSDATLGGCNLRNLANLCLAYASDGLKEPEFLDLNMNGQKDRDITTLIGMGVCEDQVPCHALIDTCCGYEITPRTCKGYLISYWTSTGITDKNEIKTLIKSTVREGTCTGETWYDAYKYEDTSTY